MEVSPRWVHGIECLIKKSICTIMHEKRCFLCHDMLAKGVEMYRKILYLAVLVARLVGLHISQSLAGKERK